MSKHEHADGEVFFQPRLGVDGLAARYMLWRLAEKVVIVASGCWEWVGSRNQSGYGVLSLKNPDWPESTALLHRIVYAACVGPVPEGASICHHCDNPSCLRPSHLFVGSNADNVADKVNKGRQASGEQIRTNHEHLRGDRIKTARLTAEDVMSIREAEQKGESIESIAKRFAVSATQVSAIVRGIAWAHLPVLSSGSRSRRACPHCGRVLATQGGYFNKHVSVCRGK